MNDQGKPKQRKFLPVSRILPARFRRDRADDTGETDDAERDEAASSELLEAIGEIVSAVPRSEHGAVVDPAAAARQLARTAAHRAALLSGSLALPPGPLGVLTVLPDLYLIWKLQRQMVADIFALHGKSAELTRANMVYCLFRHLASQVLRDVAVRAAERAVLSVATSAAVQGTASTLGMHLTRRIAGATASRWIPIAGAAAVGAYAYWDTLQVAKVALRVLAGSDTAPVLPDVEGAVQPT